MNTDSASEQMPENRSSKRVQKRLYSIGEAATYLGRTAWAVRHLVWKGMLPEVRIGKRVQIDIQDLERLVERSKPGPR